MFKSMEPLSFGSSTETDVVRRFPTTAKVFVSALAGTRTRDLPHGNRTQKRDQTRSSGQRATTRKRNERAYFLSGVAEDNLSRGMGGIECEQQPG